MSVRKAAWENPGWGWRRWDRGWRGNPGQGGEEPAVPGGSTWLEPGSWPGQVVGDVAGDRWLERWQVTDNQL